MERRCRQKNPGCVANLNCFLTVSPVNDCGDENVFMSNICMSIVSDTIAKPDCFHIGIFPANLTTRRHNRADPSPRGWLSSPYRGARIHPIALARRRGLRRSARGLARAETRAKGRAPAAVAEKNTGKRAAPARFHRLGWLPSPRRRCRGRPWPVGSDRASTTPGRTSARSTRPSRCSPTWSSSKVSSTELPTRRDDYRESRVPTARSIARRAGCAARVRTVVSAAGAKTAAGRRYVPTVASARRAGSAAAAGPAGHTRGSDRCARSAAAVPSARTVADG